MITGSTFTLSKKTVKTSAAALATCIALGISGCAGNLGARDVHSHSVGYINEVSEGTVLSMHPVTISKGESGLGPVAGAVAGGALGSEVGGGRAENIAAAVGGVIIGGLIGAAVENAATTSEGMEYVIQTVDDRKISVVQQPDVLISPGQRVYIIHGERTRIVPIGTPGYS